MGAPKCARAAPAERDNGPRRIKRFPGPDLDPDNTKTASLEHAARFVVALVAALEPANVGLAIFALAAVRP